LGVAVSNPSKKEDFKMFKLEEADSEWRRKNLDVNCKEAFNAAHVKLLSLPQSSLLKENVKEVIVAAATKGEVELFCQSGSTDKFKFLLADFVKCLLLGVRSILEEDACSDLVFLNVASFMKSFQQVASNPLTGIPEPAFVKMQMLRSVFCEIEVCVVDRFADEDAAVNKHERDQLAFLLTRYSRHVTTLLLSLGIAKDTNSGFKIFEDILNLLCSMVKFQKIEYDAENQHSDDHSD
jgi:hypothetical protein